MHPTQVAQAVEIHDGLRIPYVEQGDRDGVPLVLLHGLTDSHRSYEPVLAALPDAIRAVAITAGGHARRLGALPEPGEAGLSPSPHRVSTRSENALESMALLVLRRSGAI